MGLVSQEEFDQVQTLIRSSADAGGTKPRSVRAATSPYQLRGLLHCRLCGRRMSGHRRGPTLYYRCRAADLISSQRERHPSIVYVREDTLVPLLQEWLLGFFAPDRVNETLEALVGANEPSLAASTRRAVITGRLRDAEKRLAQYKAALGQGADVALVSAWINEATADIAHARLDLTTADSAVPQEMSREELERVVSDMSLVVARLASADPATKAALYRDLSLRLTYDYDQREVEAEVSTAEACAKRGVRGGT
ncbi:zinc ribbon domain-containing protein [Geodermatophilus sp. DF01-2]|uniref:zinc ribbon domain-containing protein n=1 Tax=Geodermatophilus sp. DF01-2 TaxID=2559610 RepID=UPI00143006D1|nr:zinc ribbon domain-containing protein [Geodermatophilus sp. DF01_2]